MVILYSFEKTNVFYFF